jgi:AraC-like DNA-binding protein
MNKVNSTAPQELAHLGFKRYLPHEYLRPWVQCYWVAQQYHLPSSGFTETLYPDGGTSLIFSFEHNPVPDVNFKSVRTASKILFQQQVDCIGIRFNPGGAFKLFGATISELIGTNQQANFFDKNVTHLQAQLSELETSDARLMLIDSWLMARARQQQLHTNFFDNFVCHFLRSDVEFLTLIEQQPLSRRQLERRFQQEIGLSPAHLKQLHRVKRARQMIAANPHLPLTQVAVDCGFYDQPHFIRNFQKITGQTPGQYKQRKMSQIYNSQAH